MELDDFFREDEYSFIWFRFRLGFYLGSGCGVWVILGKGFGVLVINFIVYFLSFRKIFRLLGK